MAHVDAIDVARVLEREFPGVSILGAGDVMTFQGKGATACMERAKVLMHKAKLFNGHLSLGHVKSKRNWHNRV